MSRFPHLYIGVATYYIENWCAKTHSDGIKLHVLSFILEQMDNIRGQVLHEHLLWTQNSQLNLEPTTTYEIVCIHGTACPPNLKPLLPSTVEFIDQGK